MGKARTFAGSCGSAGPRLPLLLLTVRDDTRDILAGFACGADDYVTKPFDREVLYARLLALGRRSHPDEEAGLLLRRHPAGPSPADRPPARGKPVALAPLEYQLLHLLMQNKGRTVTRQQLLDALWDKNGSLCQ